MDTCSTFEFETDAEITDDGRDGREGESGDCAGRANMETESGLSSSGRGCDNEAGIEHACAEENGSGSVSSVMIPARMRFLMAESTLG